MDTLAWNGPLPRHLAIIMDVNGRWAERQGLSRLVGHEQGADVVREIVRTCRKIGIEALTLYAFSAQNWGRPDEEVTALATRAKQCLSCGLGVGARGEASAHS